MNFRRELAPGGALSLAMDYSDMLLKHPGAVDEAVVQDGYMNALTDGFGAEVAT